MTVKGRRVTGAGRMRRAYHRPGSKHDVLEDGIAVAEGAGGPVVVVIKLIRSDNFEHFLGELLERYAGSETAEVVLPERQE